MLWVARHEGATGRGQFGKKPAHIFAHADDELTAALLRHTEFPRLLHLRVNPVTHVACFELHHCEKFPFGRALDAENVFHHENARLEILHVVKEGAEKIAALVTFDTGTVIGGVHLPHGAETLARWAADDNIRTVGANNRSQLRRCEAGEVALQDMRNFVF